jgi:ABC-type multidrug transport system fused ATPase/permease subunit
VVSSNLAAKRLFINLNKSILFSKMKFFDKNPKGRIINRISNDTLMVDDELPWFFHVFLENVSNCTGLCVGIIINLKWVSLSVLACLVVIFFV